MRRIQQMTLVAGLCAALASRAGAQSFVNGNFETGDLSGWTLGFTVNGTTAAQSATVIDIDGAGPLASSLAGTFCVGRANSSLGGDCGIELTQPLDLTAGTEYTFDFDWAAQRQVEVNNLEGGVFSLIVDGTGVATVAAGPTTGTTQVSGHLTIAYTPAASGSSVIGIRITRPFTPGGLLFQYVDNITISSGGGPAPCYANCDESTNPPVLNVLDFSCFLNKFAANDTYANCDQSTNPPVLNVLDFSCFLNKFAAGCS